MKRVEVITNYLRLYYNGSVKRQYQENITSLQSPKQTRRVRRSQQEEER
jgi:hypothetical protein